jgi:hypothetical protein
MSRYSGQIREVINRNSLVSLALARGYNAFLPVYDGGIDFILYNEQSGDTKLVQLKGRWTIDKKYVGRNVWIAFHDDGRWYLAPHDEMVKHAAGYGYADSKSWLEGGAYTSPRLSKAQLEDLAPYAFELLEKVAETAAESVAY